MSTLLEVNDLRSYFYTREGVIKAVDGVSFSLEKQQTLGIVGESGSGKSVTMQAILGLIPSPPGKIVSGKALFHGQDLLKLDPRSLRSIRGNKISMIFQDPMTSLNPYLKISTQLMEVLWAHHNIHSKQALHKAIEVLEMVGIAEAASRVHQYPHQFSGGMRQRVMIAMAIITKPDLIIADEPTTALDVTIQAQILELLKTMQKEMGVAIILITHDWGVVAGMSDKVAVMYAGKFVEQGNLEEVFYHHHHPYTAGLLRSLPRWEQARTRLWSIPGSPVDPSKLPSGCAFAPRCQHAQSECREERAIPVRRLAEGHLSVCHLEAKP